MESVKSLYRDLKSEWSKKNPNLKKCGTLLDQLKVSELITICIISSIISYFNPKKDFTHKIIIFTDWRIKNHPK